MVLLARSLATRGWLGIALVFLLGMQEARAATVTLTEAENPITEFATLNANDSLVIETGNWDLTSTATIAANGVDVTCAYPEGRSVFTGNRTRPATSSTPAAAGPTLWTITGDNVTVDEGCIFRDAARAIDVQGDGFRIKGSVITNVADGIRCTTSCAGLTITDTNVLHFSEDAIRMDAGSNFLVENVVLWSGYLTGDGDSDRANGIACAGTVTGYWIVKNALIGGFLDDHSTYHNGDGITGEVNCPPLQLDGLLAIDIADAGVDIKGDDAVNVTNANVIGAKRSYRFQGDGGICKNCASIDPESKGDGSSVLDFQAVGSGNTAEICSSPSLDTTSADDGSSITDNSETTCAGGDPAFSLPYACGGLKGGGSAGAGGSW